MSRIGSKNDSARMEKMLARLRARSAPASAPVPATEGAGETKADQFGASAEVSTARALGQSPVAVLAHGAPQGGQSLVGARLTALGQAPEAPTTPAGLRVVSRGDVRVAEGDVAVTSLDDLKRLEGVSHVEGNLELLETAFTADDMAALSALHTVDGDLAIEGNRELNDLGALANLEQVGGALYLGFNDQMANISLPALKQVGRALIIEGQPLLEQLNLGGLESVGGYLDVHENDALSAVHLPALKSIGEEISILDNPELESLEAPLLSSVGGAGEEGGNKNRSILQGLPNLAH